MGVVRVMGKNVIRPYNGMFVVLHSTQIEDWELVCALMFWCPGITIIESRRL